MDLVRLAINALSFSITATQYSTGVEQAKASDIVRKMLDQHRLLLKRRTTAQRVSGIEEVNTLACASGGSLRGVDTYAAVGVATVGDSIRLTYLNCREGAVTINGEVFLRLTAVQGNPETSDVFKVTLASTFTNFQLTHSAGIDVTANGTGEEVIDSRSSTTGTSIVTLNVSLAGVSAGQPVSYVYRNLRLATEVMAGQRSFTLGGVLQSSAPAIELNLSTLTPFQIVSPATFPRAGVLRLDAVTQGRVDVTALSDADRARLDLDTNRDGVVDNTTTLRWIELGL